MSRPRANKMPTTAGKAPAPQPADNELISQDPDAVLSALHSVIRRATRQFSRPFAPAITSISIASRELQDDAPTVDQEVSVYIYTPFNAENNGASFRRVEGELHNLYAEEMEEFVRLVDGVRRERAGDDEEDGAEMTELRDMLTESEARIAELEREAEKNGANQKIYKREASELRQLRKTAADQDEDLVKYRRRIAELERKVKKQDDESEDDEMKTAKLESLRDQLDEANVDLYKERVRNAQLEEEVGWFRRGETNDPPAVCGSADNADDVAAGNGEGDANDAEDDAPNFDHAGEPELSCDEPEISEKPAPRASGKKTPSNLPAYTPMPKTTRSNSKATNQSETTKKLKQEHPADEVFNGKGVHKTYTLDDKPPKSINHGVDPEAIRRKIRRESRALVTKGSSDPETPENAATGTSTAGESTDTPSGQKIADGPGRKQSKVSTKVAQPVNESVNQTDDEFAVDAEGSRKTKLTKKRKAQTSDGEEQPATSKKPKRKPFLQPPVEEESDSEYEHVHAAKGSNVSSGTKVKLPRAKQNAKRKIANDSAESEGEDEE